MAVSREQVVQAAEKLVARGKVEAAIKEYHKVLGEAPRDTSTLNRIGDLWLRLNRVDEARRTFQKTAEAYVEDGFLVKAIAIYKKIIKYDPTGLETYEKLAELYHRQGLVNEARSQYQVLADYYMKHGSTAKSTAILRQMVQLEPDNPWPRAKLAEIHQQLGAYDEALAEHRTIAELMLAQGHGEEAAKVLLNGLSVDSSDTGYIEWAVKTLNQNGQAGAAARLLATAIERNPAAHDIAVRLGLDRSRLGGTRQVTPLPRTQTPPPRLSPPRPPAAAPPLAWTPAPAVTTAPPPRPVPPAPQVRLSPLSLDETQPTAAAAPAPGEAVRLRDTDNIPLADFDEIEIEGFEPGAGSVQRLETGPAPSARDAGAQVEQVEEVEEEIQIPWQSMADLDAEPSRPAPPERQAERPEMSGSAATSGLKFDPEVLETTADEVEESMARQEDLVAEAEVYSKYGLRARALDRLREALRRNPANLDAYRVLVQMHLEQGRNDRVIEVVRQMQASVPALAQTEVWRQIRQRLLKLGYHVRGMTVSAPAPGEDDSGAHAIKSLIDEVLAGGSAATAGKAATKTKPGGPPAAVPAVTPSQAPPRSPLPLSTLAVEPAPAPPAPVAAVPLAVERTPPPPASVSTVEFVVPAPEPPAEQPPAARPLPPGARRPSAAKRTPAEELFDDTAVYFLDLAEDLDLVAPGARSGPTASLPPSAQLTEGDAGSRPPTPSAPPAVDAESLFAEEDQFFDLAAELERELAEVERAAGAPAGGLEVREQTLEEIVQGFKRGVAEVLSKEDFETHFNLGIAYREMGLLDEAIGEFQLSAKAPALVLDSSSMLGICFLDKGLPELAVKSYRRALDLPGLTEDQHLAMLYDMGSAMALAGDRDAARNAFIELYGVNSAYRDVVARLAELRR